jgi:UPF0755 protein
VAAKRKRRKNAPGRRVARAASIAIFSVFVAVALLVGVLTFTTVLSPVSSNIHAPMVTVTVEPGWGPREISEMLERRHLIRKAIGFRLAIRFNHLSSIMQPGEYDLSPAMTPRQMAELMALGRTVSTTVTIPEGFTIGQIASRLAHDGLVNETSFLDLARHQGRSFHVRDFRPPNNDLEGYLYPDTYYVPKGMSEREIITMMLSAFRQQALYRNGGRLAKRGRAVPKIMILASLIEREAKVDKDRPLIAAALENRLNKNMPLQCDAALEYVMPEHKDRLYFKDYKVDSPYNTYLHQGLTPTPIGNPGWRSIDAALDPAPVDYLYYVARKDGSHAFAATFEDFKRLKAQLVSEGARA